MRVVALILFLILLSFSVNALAVVSDYLENGTLILEDDVSKLYGIRLQNPGSEEIHIRLVYDDTFAKVIDYQEVYTIPPKSNKAISFNVSAPKSARPGKIYTATYTVEEASGRGSGIGLRLKINKNFNVKIIKNQENFYLPDLKPYLPQAILIFIIILAIIIRKFGKKNMGRLHLKREK